MEKNCNLHRSMGLWSKWFKIMKLTFFILTISFLSVNAASYSQSTKLNLKLTNQTLSDVFEEIERQSDFYFLFKNDEITPATNPSLNTPRLTLPEAPSL